MYRFATINNTWMGKDEKKPAFYCRPFNFQQ
ncbi:hypothetical protein CJA_1944 [Cellvibrio japonicus Ueda107]|uniref:Uncharacterized protein n=1 Tax=Cellvibrio japonicus (strain Ueda107) TaxID=498211 RepID=B3PGU0_CELJU|nr:hypothetical protein CJA_1944 [Cellvibrio japonicus Ueda107]